MGNTLSQVLEQYGNDPRYWQLQLGATEGLAALKKLKTWSEDPMMQGFLSLNAEMGAPGYEDQILIHINAGTRILFSPCPAVPDTPDTTLSQILDQNKNDPHLWQFALPLGAGLNQPEILQTWAQDPLIQAFMSMNAEMGVGTDNKPVILIYIPNESTRVLFTQGPAAPDTPPSTTLSQILDQNQDDPNDWNIALNLMDGDWGWHKLSDFVNNPILSGFMSMPAIFSDSNPHNIDVAISPDCRCRLLNSVIP
jgi:hypothetical protein